MICIALVEDGRELFVAQLLKVFTLHARGRSHSIAYIHAFKIGRWSKKTGYIELIDSKVRNFIFVDSVVRPCVVLSPAIKDSRHILWDLEGSDTYIRLESL